MIRLSLSFNVPSENVLEFLWNNFDTEKRCFPDYLSWGENDCLWSSLYFGIVKKEHTAKSGWKNELENVFISIDILYTKYLSRTLKNCSVYTCFKKSFPKHVDYIFLNEILKRGWLLLFRYIVRVAKIASWRNINRCLKLQCRQNPELFISLLTTDLVDVDNLLKNPLIIPIRQNNLDLVKRLIAWKPELVTKYFELDKLLPIQAAARYCKIDILKFLLEIDCSKDRTPSLLELTIKSNADEEKIIECMKLFPDSELQGLNEALYTAVLKEKLIIARFLLSLGARVCILKRHYRTVLIVAIANHRYTIIPELLKTIQNRKLLEASDNNGKSALMKIVSLINATEIISMLLNEGANVYFMSGSFTALYYMCVYYPSQLETVCKLHTDITKPVTKQGDTVLHVLAKTMESTRTHFKLAIEHGVDVNARNEKGNTVLHNLVSSSNKRKDANGHIIKEIDLTTQGTRYETAQYGHNIRPDEFHIITILLNAGVDVNLKNKKGQTAADISVVPWIKTALTQDDNLHENDVLSV